MNRRAGSQANPAPPVNYNRLDIHSIGEGHLGIFREPFDRTATLEGFRLRPASDDLTVWQFKDPQTGKEGLLLNVAAFLEEDHVAISSGGLGYIIRERGRLLALYLPPRPRRIKLTEANFKPVTPKAGAKMFWDTWPPGLVVRVVRSWMSRIVIIDEKYLLARLTR